MARLKKLFSCYRKKSHYVKGIHAKRRMAHGSKGKREYLNQALNSKHQALNNIKTQIFKTAALHRLLNFEHLNLFRI
jgi:hypothetical protein